jgi:O-antigen/teichoic acid export membrane protein
VTNIGTSLAEDGAVVGVTLLAWQHPWAAAAIALTLLVSGLALVYFLLSRIRRGLARLRERRSRLS